ncbi:hypothetical protein [Streptomyces thermoalcalitolerans]
MRKPRRYSPPSGGASSCAPVAVRGKGLGEQRCQSLLGREKTAVRHARKLVSLCPHTESYEQWTRRSGHAENCDPLKRDPSSDVWRLLVHLGIVKDEAPDG